MVACTAKDSASVVDFQWKSRGCIFRLQSDATQMIEQGGFAFPGLEVL
jgi:hypothetical protein